MLLSDREVVLNEVERALRVAAERHRETAELVGDATLRDLLESMAGRREDWAERSAETWPNRRRSATSPDADTEFFHGAVSRVKAALAPVPDHVIAREAVHDESELLAAIGAAFEVDLPEAERASLDELRREVESGRRDLEGWTG